MAKSEAAHVRQVWRADDAVLLEQPLGVDMLNEPGLHVAESKFVESHRIDRVGFAGRQYRPVGSAMLGSLPGGGSVDGKMFVLAVEE